MSSFMGLRMTFIALLITFALKFLAPLGRKP